MDDEKVVTEDEALESDSYEIYEPEHQVDVKLLGLGAAAFAAAGTFAWRRRKAISAWASKKKEEALEKRAAKANEKLVAFKAKHQKAEEAKAE